MRGLLFVLLGAVSAAVASQPRVICTSSNPAELSGNVTLTCECQANLEVLQITWQKKRGKHTQNMVTWSEKYGTHITEPFKKHITVLKTASAESSISITKLEKEDEACYNCLFNVYPNGAFTGEICLTDLKSGNEVFCNGQGNGLRIDLNPRKIQMRQSVQLIKENNGAPAFSTVKGQYLDPSINPRCEFWLEKKSVQEDQNNPPEDTDKFVLTQCSASGSKEFVITWNNEGQPVSQEKKVSKTGNLITVTSTLNHTVSSLPADHRIICKITLDLPPEADPEKAARSAKEPTLGNVNKDDRAMYEAQQQHPWVRYLMISFGIVLLAILILILFYCKAHKKTEAKTPRKQAGNGPEAPPSSIKKLVRVIKGWDSPKFSTENDSGPAIPSPINKGTPSNSGKGNPRETLESSVKKRNLQGSKKSTSAIKKLEFNEHLCK